MVAAHVRFHRLTGGRFGGGREADGGVVLLETIGAHTGQTRAPNAGSR